MKVLLVGILSIIVGASAFSPACTTSRQTNLLVLQAEASSRKAFISSAASAVAGAFLVAPVANAGTMAQRTVTTPTEQWETGKATPEVAAARKASTGSYVPIKRLNLERKSPVQRLDIGAPNFTAYKKTLPGLYKTLDQAIGESKNG
jgi:hypothetical protein